MVCLGLSLAFRGRRSSARNTAIQDHCRRPKVFFHRQNIFIERLERRMHRKRKRVTIQEMDVNKVFADIEAIAADANPPEDSS